MILSPCSLLTELASQRNKSGDITVLNRNEKSGCGNGSQNDYYFLEVMNVAINDLAQTLMNSVPKSSELPWFLHSELPNQNGI